MYYPNQKICGYAGMAILMTGLMAVTVSARRPPMRPVQEVFGLTDLTGESPPTPKPLPPSRLTLEPTTVTFLATTTPFTSHQLRRPAGRRARPPTTTEPVTSTASLQMSPNPFPVFVARNGNITAELSAAGSVPEQVVIVDDDRRPMGRVGLGQSVPEMSTFTGFTGLFPQHHGGGGGGGGGGENGNHMVARRNLNCQGGTTRSERPSLMSAREGLLRILQFLSSLKLQKNIGEPRELDNLPQI
ncbi:hypothetical protein BV898_01711 [Hypsibius exemplaris]|uniref:Uncharacterized protein n=1 Tax=Hypsibius exemplaris TaxID=2072580 RepID=A0A1W0XBG3_HYPEX|nr:hypothetical protein BV898_01711 [Hypsibius exemplaris]